MYFNWLIVKGNAEVKSSGALAAIARQAELIHPDAETPVIALESSNNT